MLPLMGEEARTRLRRGQDQSVEMLNWTGRNSVAKVVSRGKRMMLILMVEMRIVGLSMVRMSMVRMNMVRMSMVRMSIVGLRVVMRLATQVAAGSGMKGHDKR